MGDRLIFIQEEPRGNSQLVEIPVNTNGLSRVNLPDIQQLRSTPDSIIVTKGIRLITTDALAAPPITGGVNAPLAELQKVCLTIYCEGWEKGFLIPLLTLNDMNFNVPGVALPARFDNWRNIDWSKSYLFYSNGQASANAPYTVMLDVQYVRINAAGLIQSGPY